MYERLLKAVLTRQKAALFGVLIALAAPRTAGAAVQLVVGSVRDTHGNALAGATVRALDAGGKAVGSDLTARNGTFVVVPAATPAALEVSCVHCRTERVPAGGRTNFAIVVLRYAALDGGVPSDDDLSALPYVRPADALGLIPFALPSADGRDISDRGLQGGNGLVLDDGAPVYDLTTGESALIDFPGRSVRRIDAIDADKAFEYGSYAGGGTFALDQLGDSTSLAGEAGGLSTLALEPRSGIFAPAVELSDADGLTQRRADFDLDAPFAGGALRAGFTSAASLATPGPADAYRNLQLERVAYATVSRRYVTSLDVTSGYWNETDGLSLPTETSGSETSASVRVERPNAIAVAAGANLTQQTGYSETTPSAALLAGRVTNETAYFEASGEESAGGFFAGLGVAKAGQSDSLSGPQRSGTEAMLLPSLELHAQVSDALTVRVGASDSFRAPTLLEAAAARSVAIDRASLLDAALSFDDRKRLHVEAIAFREFLQGSFGRRTAGLGVSLVWQIAPRLSLRVWSLNDSPLRLGPVEYYDPSPQAASRQVLWTTYDIPAGIRVDAILQRDVTSGRLIGLDGDIVLPLRSQLSAVAGTSRIGGRRFYSFGLRVR